MLSGEFFSSLRCGVLTFPRARGAQRSDLGPALLTAAAAAALAPIPICGSEGMTRASVGFWFLLLVP